jgi:hypothetical protein
MVRVFTTTGTLDELESNSIAVHDGVLNVYQNQRRILLRAYPLTSIVWWEVT